MTGAILAISPERPALLVSNFPSDRVLIVDGDETERSALGTLLTPLRVQTADADSLHDAQRILSQADFAVAIVAARGQQFAGTDVVRAIRSDPHSAHVPILFLADSAEEIHALTQNDTLQLTDLALKPLDPVVLRAKVSILLELQRNAAQVHRLAEQLRAARLAYERQQTRAAFTDRLLEARGRGQSIEAILHATLPSLGDAAVLTLLEDGGIRNWHVSAMLASPSRLDLDDWRLELIPADVIRTASALVVLDTSATQSETPNIDVLRDLGVGSCLCLPLITNGRVLGTMMFLKAQQGHHSGDDVDLASELCQRLALTLENLRRYEIASRERAELEASCRAKDAFLSTLSHELRTPLNAIVGWANMLATGEVDGGRRAHAIETIDRNARALTLLVADLVDRQGSSSGQAGTDLTVNRSIVSELLSGVHALVVEDDPDSSELVEAILRRFGADVTCVGTVGAALGALAVRRPDVLVSDIGLPDDDGLTLIRRIREMRDLAALPAIALSAYASRRDISQALAAGFQAYIAKPVEPDQLGRMIADVVNG